jgi:excinuclease ABC subunit A
VSNGKIELRGVAVNNLRHVDLDLPHHQLIVFCGVSGSGKTSMALDTLYAEGQRRYIESFSPYTRQFLEQLDKPDAERIDGIPPAIAVTHKNPSRSNRATVGTVTEVNDYLSLLFARVGEVICYRCGQPVRRESPEAVAESLVGIPEGSRILVGFDVTVPSDDPIASWLAEFVELGYVRAVVEGRIESVEPKLAQRVQAGDRITIVLDRLLAGGASAARMRESLEGAFAAGEGACVVLVEGGNDARPQAAIVEIDGRAWLRWSFSAALRCEACGIDYPEPEPQLFDFNRPLGACAECEGFGNIVATDMNRVVPDPGPCPACGGARLRPEALAVQVGGKSFADVCRMKTAEALAFLEQLAVPEWQQRIAQPLLADVCARLAYLVDVGLGYLALERSLRTLSGGEAQRVALTATLGSSLVDMLYVLDEPSIGLHPADVPPLATAIERLQQRGNTVVVVEHEEEIMRRAGHVVEFGPSAGEEGGRIVFQGTPKQLEASRESRTGDWLAGRRTLGGGPRRGTGQGWVKLREARGNNLQNLTVEFPLGVLCLVTGVSGAGKSTLVDKTLYPALAQRLQKDSDRVALPEPLAYDDLLGAGQLEEVVHIDQSPIGRSPRSNPATYIKAFDPIRVLFAEQPEARARGLTAGHFSFNVDGGRCERCQGDGLLTVDMQFMADVYMRCPECRGRRYRPQVLEVKHRGLDIAEVLDMTVRQAFTFFRGQRKIQAKLKHLLDVGLDYLRLGQSATTLSGGEAQRLKLAAHLAAKRHGRALFVLDEPTIGLHFSDIVQLVDCFDALLEVGHSLVVVDHNLQLMKAADWLIDLGPGAADEGGRIVATGTPEEVAACEQSRTGRILAQQFARDAALMKQ